MNILRPNFRFIAAAAFALLTLPAAKSGCGPEVPIGSNDCGGVQGLTCGANEYCHYDNNTCGAADELGTCTPTPDECYLLLAPVCGCDGNTYGNDCEANTAGVSIAAEGECGTSANACGGVQGLTCGAGEYCDYEDMSCGIADELGECKPIPSEDCYTLYAPVCGCDGMTYGNDCEAIKAGVSIAATGECNAPKDCGGIQNLLCDADEFCDYTDNSCGIADELGQCAPRPDNCDTGITPVCGCDGMTYNNECEANAAGVSSATEGACN